MKTISVRLTDDDERRLNKIKEYLELYNCKASTTKVIRGLINSEYHLIKNRFSKSLFKTIEELK